MDYPQALAYLYDKLPVFHRIGAKAIKPGLGNTEALCAALGNPERRFRSIHVGGTNGKGSTAHLLASVYQAAGYRVGLYTSPHLQSFTERIRINGRPIDGAAVAAFVTQHRLLIETIEPSFFEVTVGMAFDYFARQGVDLAIVEVGLGGRLDSTNVITPDLAIITNIGLDHTDILGDTLTAIAGEKAGIIKAGVPVVVGETQPESAPVFRRKAAGVHAPLTFADQVYAVADGGLEQGRRLALITRRPPAGDAPGLPPPPASCLLDLTGIYQLRNLPAVVTAVEQLQPVWPVSADAFRQGVATVMSSTGLRGRFQTLQTRPRVVADTAHNPPGLLALLETIRSLTYRRLHLIVGFVQDKDVPAVLRLLPAGAYYYFCQSHTPRSLPADALAGLADAAGLPAAQPGRVYTDVNEALAAALAGATPDDLLVVTGSAYLVAELDSLG